MNHQVMRSCLGFAIAAIAACSSTEPSRSEGETYLRWVAFEVPGGENVLLRWHERRMPLRVFLPPPPEGLFEDPVAIHESVRDGVLDWSGVGGSDLPAFVFVENIGDADIPFVWAEEPDGNWYIAFCSYDIQPLARRFGVSHILVTGRWGDGRVADLHDVYATVLHEMGHALGLGGHSPDSGDIMSPSISRTATSGLSLRDRATLSALYSRPIGTRIFGARRAR